LASRWLAVPLLLALWLPAVAEKHYDPGASDTEIRIGTVTPTTGSLSEFSAESRAQAGYFHMINDRGGINGRRITFISRDDGSDPRRSLGLARQLVEEDQVLLLFSTFGSAGSRAIRSYANEHRIPQLFVQSSAGGFDDPAHYPWTMGFFASYRTEARAYAKYILETRPQARIGVLLADDEVGRETLDGLKEGLGTRASSAIVKEAVFRYADPQSIDRQIEALKASGADVFVNVAIGRSASQAIRTAYDIGWRPLQFVPNASLSVASFLDPAGLDKATGIISNARSKGWDKAQSRSDPAVAEFLAWMKQYVPQENLRDQLNVGGYERAQALVEVLRRCGDELTRDNVMKQAASLDLELGMLRPGIRIHTGPADYQPIKDLFLVRFDGKDWVPLVR
jgi:ABC-type branched-subunit amino acid transport system substrate-binding protein